MGELTFWVLIAFSIALIFNLLIVAFFLGFSSGDRAYKALQRKIEKDREIKR